MKAHWLICWATKPTGVLVYRNPINWEIEGKEDKIARCWESSFSSFNRKSTFEPCYCTHIGIKHHTHTHPMCVCVCNYICGTVHFHRFYFACITWYIKMFNIFNMKIFIIGLVLMKSIFLFYLIWGTAVDIRKLPFCTISHRQQFQDLLQYWILILSFPNIYFSSCSEITYHTVFISDHSSPTGM